MEEWKKPWTENWAVHPITAIMIAQRNTNEADGSFTRSLSAMARARHNGTHPYFFGTGFPCRRHSGLLYRRLPKSDGQPTESRLTPGPAGRLGRALGCRIVRCDGPCHERPLARGGYAPLCRTSLIGPCRGWS